MLVNHTSLHARARGTRRQHGVVMLVALIVLVVMTLAGIALMRSMDTTNLIAGNMAFKQSATNSADTGVEAAIGWLELNRGSDILWGTNPLTPNWYHASIGLTPNATMAAYPLGDAYWNQLTANDTVKCNVSVSGCSGTPKCDAGNCVSYVIHRLCQSNGNRNGAFCAYIPGTVASTGNNEGPEGDALTGSSSSVYYRITVRVDGPRNSVSYVQTIVNL
jgi:type IV pilus assembly protein PilX